MSLADDGAARIAWVRSRMTMLADLRTEFSTTLPFAGRTIGVSLHLEPKTAVLLETLVAGGARVVGTGNHGSTQDDIVAALVAEGIEVFGRRDDDWDAHHLNLARTLDAHPDVLLDNGADLALGALSRGQASEIVGGTEETTSGGFRLREGEEQVPFPVIVINDSRLKAIGENRHGVGQSAVESLMRLTNTMIPGRRFVVLGYGFCGRGTAQYLRTFGGKVAVVEPDPITALEAALDGYRVASLPELADWAEVIITATGRDRVLGADIADRLADGVLLANIGHFPTEIDVPALTALATSVTEVAPALTRLDLPDGRHLLVVADGRMFNLAGPGARRNSIEAMDLGFMLQSLSLERVVTGDLEPGPQPVPRDIEERIARTMVTAMGADC